MSKHIKVRWRWLKERRRHICMIAHMADGQTYTTITAARKAIRRVKRGPKQKDTP